MIPSWAIREPERWSYRHELTHPRFIERDHAGSCPTEHHRKEREQEVWWQYQAPVPHVCTLGAMGNWKETELESSFPKIVTPQQLPGSGDKKPTRALLRLLKSNFSTIFRGMWNFRASSLDSELLKYHISGEGQLSPYDW